MSLRVLRLSSDKHLNIWFMQKRNDYFCRYQSVNFSDELAVAFLEDYPKTYYQQKYAYIFMKQA